MASNAALVEVLAALGERGGEGDAEGSAPVAEEVGKAGGAVVLVRAELGVGEHGERDEEEGVAEALQGARPGEVPVVGLQVEAAVVDERDADDGDGTEEHGARVHDAALHELRADRSEQCDDEGSGTEDEAGVCGAIAEEGLEDLR